MIRVVVADDHTVVREGIRRILERSSDIRVVAEATSGDEVIAALKQSPVNVLLLDIEMPGPDFTSVIQSAHEMDPRLRVLILSVHPEEQFAIRALRAGAAGYMTKDYSTEQLTGAIRRVAEGRKYISDSLAELLAIGLDRDLETPLHESLSDREHQVLRLLSKGKSLKEIAAQLAVNPKTVTTYRTRVLQKLGLKTNADLVRYALENDLLR